MQNKKLYFIKTQTRASERIFKNRECWNLNVQYPTQNTVQNVVQKDWNSKSKVEKMKKDEIVNWTNILKWHENTNLHIVYIDEFSVKRKNRKQIWLG